MSAQASNPLRQSILLALALLYQGTGRAELPSGATVVGGAASVSHVGGNQVIHQGTQRAIIDWQNFSIGAGNSVRINQPNTSSVLLNRVVGGNASNILGNLSANGQVFLVNPFGVYFGAGATVDVGGLLATTLNIRNEDFMAGNYLFNRSSLSSARREVINAGVLKAREGGYVVLAGDYAASSGVIQARLGTAALASGDKMTLDIKGDNLINFTVDEKTVAELSGVENRGQILADGGRAIMTASVARDLATATVNSSGLIQARSTVERDGAIYLSADGGNTLVSGRLDASGKEAGRKGGTIAVLGDKVALTGTASVDAAGDAGGGKINVGGNFQGQGPLQNSRTAFVGKDVRITADALGNGNGGEVVVWADDHTRFYGDITARGGAQGGDGGNVEVSGKAILDYNGTVNTLAPQGKAGTLLLDPTDIEIVTTVDPATADMTGASPFSDATNNGGTSRMSVGALEAALAAGNVTVTTQTASGTAPKGGTITIDDGAGGGVQWTNSNTLKLQANNQILIKSNLQGGNGTLWLDAGNGVIQSPGSNIAANGLLLTGAGFFDLVGVTPDNFVGSWNDVNTLATNFSSASTLRYSSNRHVSVGTVDGVTGINNVNGSTQFYFDRNGAVLTLAQGVTSGSMFYRGSGGVNQTGGTAQLSSLSLQGGPASFSMAGNNIRNLTASINGDLIVTTAGAMTINGGGITTTNHNVTLTTGDAAGFDATKQPDGSTNPASLTINESINAGAGAIRLNAGTGGVYQRRSTDASGALLPNGSLTAGALLLRGNSTSKVTPFVLNNANNLVGTLAASVNGSVSYTGGPLMVGSIDGINGITTTSNTIVVPAGVDASGRATPDVYNENNVSLSVGGNLTISQNINAATTNGSDAVSLGIGGDFTALTTNGSRINADTLGVFGDDLKGTFGLRTNVSSLAAAGGKLMVIDNSDHVGDLTGIGIGAPAANASATNNGSTVSVDSASKPVGDFYLTTAGGLNIIKLMSKGSNLMLRSSSLDILLDATTADGARIMLQPYNLASKVGINNSVDTNFTPDINYSGATLLKFTNPTATFFIGTPQNAILNDIAVPNAARNTLTGDVHIGSDGAFNLGYRSLSAQTSGNMVAHNVGPLYNLRLAAPNLTINGFNTFGPQMHFFSNNLSLPGTADKYINPNKPEITLRTLNEQTVWIGNSPKSWEPNFTSKTIQKLPDGSTIIISGSTDYPFPSAGDGYGDIHIPWNDSVGVGLGNRKLVLSTGKKVYAYGATPAYTKKDDGGTSGGLWKGCDDLTTCMGTNPNPFPDPAPVDGDGGGNDNNPGNNGDTGNPDNGKCVGCPPAPPNDNPYPPDTTPTDGGDGNTGGDDGTDNTDSDNDSDGDSTDDGGDDGSGSDSGGDGDGGDGDGSDDNGDDNSGPTDSTDGDGDSNGDGGAGTDSGGDGDGGDGDGDDSSGPDNSGGNDGDGDTGGDDGAGTDSGGDGDGNDGDGDGDGGDGTGDPGDGDMNDGSDTGGTGDGDGDGDGGAGTDSGGDGDDGDGDGDGGDGTGDGSGDDNDGSGSGGDGDGDGAGDGGSGTDSGGDGDGSGGTGDGNGDGGDGTGDGGDGSGDGAGDGGAGTDSGGNGDGKGGDGTGTGSGDDGGGTGEGGAGDGSGDAGAGTGSGGTADGSDGDGTGAGANSDGDGRGAGGTGDGDGDAGAGTDSGGKSDGKSGSGDGDGSGEQSDAFAPTAVDISCGDIATAKDQGDSGRRGQSEKKRLVEIKRDGVKLRDPCQKQPEQNNAK